MIGSFLGGIYMGLGTLLFIYVEHCFDKVPKQNAPYESSFIDLCNDISRYHNTTKIFNQTENTVVQNALKECLPNILNNELTKCEITLDTFSKWAKFTIAVCCTIGTYLLVLNRLPSLILFT